MAPHRGAKSAFASRKAAYRIAIAGGTACLLWGSALAVETPTVAPHPVRDFDNYIPTGIATRIETSEAPTIDGDPSEAIWQKAQVKIL